MDEADEITTIEADKVEIEEPKPDAQVAAGEESEEVVVTLGESPAPEDETKSAPEWVRDLRRTHRETVRENKELKARLETQQTKTVELGPKPKLADPDIDYDTDKFETALAQWQDRKRAQDQAITDRQAAAQREQQDWQKKLDTYGEQKQGLKVKDFEDAESVVLETFSQTQQGIILQGAENSALVIYALGKNPSKVKELAGIKDPVKFAFAVAKLEETVKVTTRKPPPPEKVVTGTAPTSGSVDSTLERLRAEAEKTGDYTKVTQYKKQKRQSS